MGIIDAGIGGKLITSQFATLPGTVERMLQDRSLANQIIQGTEKFFGSHRGTMLRRLVAERKSKNICPKGVLHPSSPVGMDSRFSDFRASNQKVTRIWTIGHSTRTTEEFIGALQASGIKLVADVRLSPGSKRYPQFNKEELARSLSEDGIGYEHFPELGGRRNARKDSRNTAWRNESFRGYADHMETAEFAN